MLIDGFLYLLAFAIRVRRGDVFSARRSIHVIIPGELAGRRHFNACGVRKSGISCHFSDFAVVDWKSWGLITPLLSIFQEWHHGEPMPTAASLTCFGFVKGFRRYDRFHCA